VLPIDLERSEAALQLLALARGRERIRLQELYPELDRMCAIGADGHYAHEMLIPFVRSQTSPAKRITAPAPFSVRTFPPGSRWLYAKIYTGPATSDRVLRTAIAPLMRDVLAAKWIENWFFIRYADPEPHLRVRIQGAPDHLLQNVLPLLHNRLAPLLLSGRVARIQLDTYEREVERYGGEQAILVAEQIFAADSDAVLQIVEQTVGEAGPDARWRLALYGMHTLLTDAGFDDVSRRALVTRGRDAFAAEHRIDKVARQSIAGRYRTHRVAIEHLLGNGPEADESLRPFLPILRIRSAAVRPLFAELRALRDAGKLGTSWGALIQSFLHMHVNRVIRADQRAHEMVFYDFLFRGYESAAARASAPSR
jgi:thiopeptide-type bacteriocin biosynthesis protein